MTAAITIQRPVRGRGVPGPGRLRRWAKAALGRRGGEVTVRVVGRAESRRLNRRYRGRDKATNVLSFPYTPSPLTPLPQAGEGNKVLGDLVICAPVVNREAREQGKAAAAHWAHMVVHGVLHLLGYDHIRPSEARVMEAKERAILARLSFPDPYG